MSKKQTELEEYWTEKGYFVVNNISTNKSGMPDLSANKPDEVIFIESKEEWDSLEPNQIARLNQLTRKGFKCYVNYDRWEITNDKTDTDLF